MAELVFIALCIAGAFVLAMRRAPLWAWAAGPGGRDLRLAVGHAARRVRRAEFGPLGLLAWVPVIVLAGLSVPADPARRADPAALPQDQGHPAQGLRHRAGGAQRRHHRLRCRAVLRPARLGEAARRSAHHADRGGEGLPRRADQRAVPDGQRLGDPPQRQGDPRGGLELRQEARLPRHAHLQGARRPRLLAAGAVAGAGPHRLALARRVHHRHGAELAGAGRADREVRHARAEAPLPAAPRQGPGGALLRADRARPPARTPPPCATSATSRRAGTRARRWSASAPPGRSATSRWRRRRRWSASPSACSIPRTCWAAARTSASPWRCVPADHPGVEIGRRHLPSRRRLPERARSGAATSSSRWTG